MAIYKQLPEYIHNVDVIVAGGGTAGCIIASRLAEADPNLSILVIEQGMNNYNVDQVVHPALFPSNLLADSKTALFWKGKTACRQGAYCPVRGYSGRRVFDQLDGLHAASEFETYHGRGQYEHHGHNGPVNISSGTFRAKRAENEFIEAAAKVGYRELKDLQNLDANNGTERWLRYVGPDGRRQDAAHRFLHPKLHSGDYPNLHVLVEHQTVRILFDNRKRVVGVEFRPNPKFQPHTANRRSLQSVKGSKMVILSASANETPLILERSGVGDPVILERAKVPVVQSLPSVGNDYQDHHLTLYAYRTDLSPRETINGFANGQFNIQEMIQQRDELLGWNSMDASGKFRPTEEEVAALGPDFMEVWDRDFRDASDRPLMIIAMYLSFFGDFSTLPDNCEYVSMANWTAYPYSRGHIHITGQDPSDPIDFDVGYLKDPNGIDVKKHIWAYKIQREIFRRMAIFRGELASSHPKFPAGSDAAVIEKADGPVAGDTQRIRYTAEDDSAIDQHVRRIVSTTWHSLGTCKMAPREKGGVVDADLNVYGVRGLKLADLSIPPKNVGVNTNNCALMIGGEGCGYFYSGTRSSEAESYLKRETSTKS